MGLRDALANAMPDPMTLSMYDGKDPAQQRAAARQILLVQEQRATNHLLQALLDLQQASLDQGRVR